MCNTTVTIDYEDRESVERLRQAYLDTNLGDATTDMQAALREFANPTPPIREPRGQGAVVEDADGKRWLRRIEGGQRSWMHYDIEDRASRARDWSDITAVRVLSEGVTR